MRPHGYCDHFIDLILQSFQSEQRSAVVAGDDWADVGADVGRADAISTPLPTRGASKTSSHVSVIPDIKDIPRPDILLSQQPYHIIVTMSGKSVQIQSSHSPTLNFLANYLRKWCRTDVSSTARVSRIESWKLSLMKPLLTHSIASIGGCRIAQVAVQSR